MAAVASFERDTGKNDLMAPPLEVAGYESMAGAAAESRQRGGEPPMIGRNAATVAPKRLPKAMAGRRLRQKVM